MDARACEREALQALARHVATGLLQSHIATLMFDAHKRCIRKTRPLLLANRTGDGSATLFAKDTAAKVGLATILLSHIRTLRFLTKYC